MTKDQLFFLGLSVGSILGIIIHAYLTNTLWVQ